ncbi:DUF1704 domain-containing protein [bacterium]|nr:DUF1704 domain-containing protein [bacterium]
MREFSETQLGHLSEAATRLREAERPVRILRSLAWPQELARNFIDGGMQQPPEPEYPVFDPRPVISDLAAIDHLLEGDSPVHDWLRRVAWSIATAARMLGAIGTPEFHEHSAALYGTPVTPLQDGQRTAFELAELIDEILFGFNQSPASFGIVPRLVPAEQLAEEIERRIAVQFGDNAPAVELVDQLSSKALAGARYIRIRRGARFTDQDVEQLVNHEAFVHIGTTLNGVAQQRFPILASAHAGTTRTQEGLAVFTEFMSAAMDPDRFQRLAERTIAIKMSMDGADFMQLFAYFRERTDTPEQAFECCRRVVRGGLVNGHAPFTKDCTYIHGLLQVHNFLRIAVASGRIDCIGLLFCGKLDLEDLPALGLLANAGVLEPPRYLPPCVSDPRFLVSYLAYSSFLNRIDLPTVKQHYGDMLGKIPATELMAGVCYLDRSQLGDPAPKTP